MPFISTARSGWINAKHLVAGTARCQHTARTHLLRRACVLSNGQFVVASLLPSMDAGRTAPSPDSEHLGGSSRQLLPAAEYRRSNAVRVAGSMEIRRRSWLPVPHIEQT